MIRIPVALAALALALPAAAETLVSRAGPPLAVTVEADAAALSDPRLAAFLRAESAAIVETWEAMAAETGPAALRIDHRTRFASATHVSILRTISYAGGTDPATTYPEALTLDLATGAFLRLDDLLDGPAGGRALAAISAALRARLEAGADPASIGRIRGATVADLTVLQNFTLEPSTEAGRIGGLAFHFGPREVAESPRPVAVTIPQSLFRAGLRPELADMFGGEPLSP